MVAAAEVEPLHSFHILAKAFLERLNRAHQIVRILLAQGMEVQAVNAVEQFRLKIFLRDAQTRTGAARVVNGVFRGLGRTLRVDAQTAAFACRARKAAVGLPLGKRVEHNMVGIMQDFLKFALGIGGRVDMRLAAKFFVAQARFIQAGRGRARQIFAQQRVDREHGKRLLRQQDLCARAFGYVTQDGQILHQTVFIHKEAGRGQFGKSHISPPIPGFR